MSNDHHVLDSFFNGKSIAVIGASKNPVKGGNRILNNLTTNKYKGVIYPVNPNYKETDEVYGLKFVKSVLDVKEDIDLAIIYVGNKLIPGILKDCVTKGIKAALIQASGFEEVGSEGLKLRDEIREITGNFKKIRIVGPNCMGLTRIDGDFDNEEERGGFFSGFGVLTNYKKGNIAIITQSGMLNGGFITGIFATYPNMGFRYIASIGNKMDLGETDFLDYFLRDPSINVIAIYLESFKKPREFISLCRKANSLGDKTIILVKGGTTLQGQKAALSHTGSLSENIDLTESIIKQAGVIRADSFFEMFQFSRTFSFMYKTGKKFPVHGKIALIIGSGGAGTIMSDLAMKHGLTYAEFGDESYEILKSVFPSWMPPNRFALVDTWPTMEKAITDASKKVNVSKGVTREERWSLPGIGQVMQKVQQAVLSEPEVEGLFTMMPGVNRSGGPDGFNSMLESISKLPKPIFFWSMSSGGVGETSKFLGSFNLPSFNRSEDAIKNFAILVQDSKNKIKFRKIENGQD